MATLELEIEKMHCGACVRRVTQTLNAVPDTHATQVAVGRASVASDANVEQVLGALEAAGFPARVAASQP